MADIDAFIKEIRERNARVESDKAWELSKTRRAIVAIFIYALAVVLFWFIKTPQPLIDALVPSTAYVLSTLTLPFIKTWWVKSVYKK